MSDELTSHSDVRPDSWAGVTAVILAGGLGTRLRGVVADRPKCLAPILGRPFLAHQLDWLAAAGLSRVILCTGYMAEQVEEAIGPRHGAIVVAYSREDQPLGTGGAVRLAAASVTTPAMLVLNGDSFCNADLNSLLAQFHANRMSPTMLLTHVPDISRYGQVECDGGSRVKRFLEKGSSGPGWINAGVYLIQKADILTIPEGKSFSLERDLFPGLADQHRLHTYGVKAAFIDIGTPESYSMADRFFGHPDRLFGGKTEEIPQVRG